MKRLIMILIGLLMAMSITAYTAPDYTSVDLVLEDGYTADAYTSVDLVLGEITSDCTITTNTDYVNETVNCAGQTYSVSNGANVTFTNSNLTALRVEIDISSGSSLTHPDSTGGFVWQRI